jgi:Uma2 family endonuclease
MRRFDFEGLVSYNDENLETVIRLEAAVASAALKTRLTPEQYLAIERQSGFKSEYLNGFITAMSGASRAHNRIAGNVYRKLSDQLENRPCEAFISDLRLCVNPTGLYTYPDVMVVCGETEYLDEEVDTLLNPTLVIEVLSPTTESYDRGAKFGHYRRLTSLKEYVLISQDQILVERFTRHGDDWLLSVQDDLADTLRLESIDCSVPLREIYAKVSFSGSQKHES